MHKNTHDGCTGLQENAQVNIISLYMLTVKYNARAIYRITITSYYMVVF